MSALLHEHEEKFSGHAVDLRGKLKTNTGMLMFVQQLKLME
jgi:hypothetical protein